MSGINIRPDARRDPSDQREGTEIDLPCVTSPIRTGELLAFISGIISAKGAGRREVFVDLIRCFGCPRIR